MAGTWGHDAKWNTSDREKQTSYDLTDMQNQINKQEKKKKTSS